MPVNPADTNNSAVVFDLGSLLAFAWQKKIRITLLTALMVVSGGYHINELPRFYTASSTLLLGNNEDSLRLPGSVASFASTDDTRLDTYIEFMRSRNFIESVVRDLELHKSSEFQPAKPFSTGIRQLEYSIDLFLRKFSVNKVGETDLIRINFESKVPKTAANVVNHLGPAFFVYHDELSKRRADDTSKWLNSQLEQLGERVSQAEEELQNFLSENRLIDVRSQIDLVRTELSALMSEKLANEKILASSTQTINRVNRYKSDINKLIETPWIINNSLVIDIRNKITQQKQRLAEVSKRYKEKHHKYIAEQSRLNSLNDELEILLGKLVSGLEQEHNQLLLRKQQLASQIEAVRSEHGELGRHDLQLARLRREVESTHKMYELFVARIQETEIAKDLGDSEEFVVVDYATVPKIPSRPKVSLLIAVLTVISAFASLAFWMAIHFVSDKRSRLLQIVNRLNVPLLAEIPRYSELDSEKKRKSFDFRADKEYLYSEAIRSLRTSILVRNQQSDMPNRIVAFTGVKRGDGKSTVATKLAESFSKLEKTLLVDLDMRHPSIARRFGLLDDYPGVTNFLGRRARFSDCLYHDSNSSLAIMPSGPVPVDPIVYLSKARFSSFIKKLGLVYERLIIETPPITECSDALVVSKAVDGIVVICDIERTESVDLIDTIQQLTDSGAPLLGVVFNRVKNVRSTIKRTSALRRLRKTLLRF